MPLRHKDKVFNNAAVDFVKSIFKKKKSELNAVPGLYQSCNYKISQLVWKLKRENGDPTLTPSKYQLSDILEGKKIGPVGEKDTERLDRKDTFKRKRSFRFKLGARNMVRARVNWGRVIRKELDITELAKMVRGRKVKLDGIVTQAALNTRKTLCVIVSSLLTETAVKIFMDTKADTQSRGHTDEQDRASNIEQESSLNIPSRTPIAYSVREILVRSDRSIELVVDPGEKGGSEEQPSELPTSESPCPRTSPRKRKSSTGVANEITPKENHLKDSTRDPPKPSKGNGQGSFSLRGLRRKLHMDD